MSPLIVLLTPLAVAAAGAQPDGPGVVSIPSAVEPAAVDSGWSGRPAALAPLPPSAPRVSPVWGDPVVVAGVIEAQQVRIDQRLVIRIPSRGSGADRPAVLPNASRPARVRERKVGSCVSAARIAGVDIAEDDRLLLFMRDRRVIGATLERGCQPRDFYSGFYVERSRDGRICVARDLLHARTGTSCTVRRLRQLVPEPG